MRIEIQGLEDHGHGVDALIEWLQGKGRRLARHKPILAPFGLCCLAAATSVSAQTVTYSSQPISFQVVSINGHGQALGFNNPPSNTSPQTPVFGNLPVGAPLFYSNGTGYAISTDLSGCGTQFVTDSSGDIRPVQLTENGSIMIWAAQSEGCLLTPVPGSGTAINTATGLGALQSNAGGASNTADGYDALNTNSTGANNTAFGANALFSNTVGKGNAAQGVNALYSNTTGIRNLGIGSNALYEDVSGSYNVALGFDAGYNATGNDNIYIANSGQSGESQTLRLGTQGSSGVQGSGILTAYVAGVATSQVTGSAVYITASGQLGVLASSERFKTDVKTMADASDKLKQLRPVTFKLNSDPSASIQYGLIAEEVAKVYPELVIRGADGRIVGVRYEELTPLLLREMQRQQVRVQEQQTLTRTLAEQNKTQAAQIRKLHVCLDQLTEQSRQVAQMRRAMLEMHATLAKIQRDRELVANR